MSLSPQLLAAGASLQSQCGGLLWVKVPSDLQVTVMSVAGQACTLHILRLRCICEVNEKTPFPWNPDCLTQGLCRNTS